MGLLLLKLVVPPLLIAAASLAEKRWGPAIGGWLISLPFVSGPVALFIALESGVGPSAAAAAGSLGGTIAVVAYCLAYARVAVVRPWGAALAVAVGSWLAGALAAGLLLGLPVPLLFLVVAAVTLGAYRLMPVADPAAEAPSSPAWEIPLRMLAGMAIVVTVTAAAPFVGAGISGLLAMVPVVSTVLSVFGQRRAGPSAAIGVLRGIVAGATGTAAFLAVVSGTIEQLGIAGAFVAATATGLLLQSVILAVLRRSHDEALVAEAG